MVERDYEEASRDRQRPLALRPFCSSGVSIALGRDRLYAQDLSDVEYAASALTEPPEAM